MNHRTAWMLFAAMSGMTAPAALVAQIFPHHHAGCCQTCTQPMAACQCARTRAVVQTHLRPEQVTTTRCVTETQVRKETYTETVPVTKMETVTVDEGGYQMVWVPKPVTRQIAKTTYTQQVKTRDVAYQVTRAVPQTVTRMVPYQTVQHVTEVVPTMAVATPAPVLGCHSCATGTAMVPHIDGTSLAPMLPMSHAVTAPIAVEQTAQGPGQNAFGDWQKIPGKVTPKPMEKTQAVPTPTDDPPQIAPPKTSGRFKAAPSAAVIWSAVGSGPRSSAVPAQNVAGK